MTIQLQIPMTITIPNDKLIQQVNDCISDIVSDAMFDITSLLEDEKYNDSHEAIMNMCYPILITEFNERINSYLAEKEN